MKAITSQTLKQQTWIWWRRYNSIYTIPYICFSVYHLTLVICLYVYFMMSIFSIFAFLARS